MTVSDADVQAAARELLDYRDHPRPHAVGGPLRGPPDLATAYRIQFALEDLLVAERGYRAIGWKIGATNPGARANVGLSAPFFGRLYDTLSSTSPATLRPVGDFYRAYEAEVALRIDHDPPETGADAAAIAAATGAVLPAIELIGTCYTPWTSAGGLNLIADAGAHGRWIMGEPVADFSGLDLLDGPTTLAINGVVKSTGRGANVERGPFGATAWLANALVAHGRCLRAGDYVTTGTVIPPIAVGAEEDALADFGELGRVALVLQG